MHSALATLVDRLDQLSSSGVDVIPWSSPVPSFGDLSASRVATVGLNPSNREFVDDVGRELDGDLRRFHTLRSLGLRSWEDADCTHLQKILESCRMYFYGNPYDRWFRRLNYVISGTQASFYDGWLRACHLDLIPYATASKWTHLSNQQRSSLLAIAGNSLGLLLRDSPVQVLILNGQSVVDHFEVIAEIALERQEVAAWSLPRHKQRNVTGIAYSGRIETLSGICLERELLVLGYNHNLQSSFGVTSEVVRSIGNWIESATREVLL